MVVNVVIGTKVSSIIQLKTMFQGYLKPLQDLLSSDDYPTGKEDIECLFCNITDIFQFGK
jgi:hypothetical protein